MYWTTQQGERIHIADMNTRHLFNSLKMVFNQLAPEEMRFTGYIEWNGVRQWDPTVTKKFITAMSEELASRSDITQDMRDKLKWMADCVKSKKWIEAQKLLLEERNDQHEDEENAYFDQTERP